MEQCDGSWEHGSGITIATIDNPGWTVTIGLTGTRWETKDYFGLTLERSESDWLQARKRGDEFILACGAGNLEEALGVFRTFIEPTEAGSTPSD